jgi:hypothetical protein
MAAWRVRGRYFEACNCDAICPCRMVGGVPGGRSTYGHCFGLLSWAIDDGYADGVDLAGFRVAMVYRYDDDEPGSPWSFVLHVDEHGDDDERSALKRIFTGRRGGESIRRQPWVRKPSTLLAIRPSRIEFVGNIRIHSIRIGSTIEVVAEDVVDDERVRCIVPGYHEPGAELRARVNRVAEHPFAWVLEGRCAYAARFDYAGDEPG